MSSKRSVAGFATLRPADRLGCRGMSGSEGGLWGWMGGVVAVGAVAGGRGVASAGAGGKKKAGV